MWRFGVSFISFFHPSYSLLHINIIAEIVHSRLEVRFFITFHGFFDVSHDLFFLIYSDIEETFVFSQLNERSNDCSCTSSNSMVKVSTGLSNVVGFTLTRRTSSSAL